MPVRHSPKKKRTVVAWRSAVDGADEEDLDESSSSHPQKGHPLHTTISAISNNFSKGNYSLQLVDCHHRIPPQYHRHVLIAAWILVSIIMFHIGFYLGQQHPDTSLWGTSTTDKDGIQHAIPSYKKAADGWACVDVFYGNATQLDTMLPPMEYNGGQPQPQQAYFSQTFQDQVVARLFRSSKDTSHNFFFVDVGAYDARTFSNTFVLQRDYHWKGLCIEPNPAYWHDLAYRGEGCQVVGAVVGRHHLEEVSFRMENGILGGMVNDMFYNSIGRDAADYPQSPANLKYTIPLADILRRYNCPKTIQYMSLDVSGAEDYIWTLFPHDEYRIEVLTVERPTDAMRAHLTKHGYQMLRLLSTWGESLWAHRSIVRRLDLAVLDELNLPS